MIFKLLALGKRRLQNRFPVNARVAWEFRAAVVAKVMPHDINEFEMDGSMSSRPIEVTLIAVFWFERHLIAERRREAN